MNRFLVILSLFCLSLNIHSNEQLSPNDNQDEFVDDEQIQKEKQKEEYYKIQKLFFPLDNHRIDIEDSQLLKTKKEAALKKELISLNSKLKGELISFSSVRNKATEEETEISEYGIKSLKNYLKKLKSNPAYSGLEDDSPMLKLAAMSYLTMGCGKKCLKKTGSYLATYEFDAFKIFNGFNKDEEKNYYELKIVQILNSEEKALLIKYNENYAVSGRIDRFEFEDGLTYRDKLIIYIK
ncbi:hypothetical protein JWG44_05700 [Leptospira sp. 201903071]|uniref:hypothetical protein n=1 Tax=Leptospira ainazelensis TaxID=2810034 RepID=UPI00196679F0|nr:hypothetical protein [Leptospira ainazelensis]MBM9499744.1 hypothetical protein [Leptospira ainazelensis]